MITAIILDSNIQGHPSQEFQEMITATNQNFLAEQEFLLTFPIPE
jgi:hypothetical protein